MIGKNVESDDNTDSLTQLGIVEKREKIVNHNYVQIQAEIRNCFARLTTILQLRERQLLHQAQMLHVQQLSVAQESLRIPPTLTLNLEGVNNVQQQILNFGAVDLSEWNCQQLSNAVGRHEGNENKCVPLGKTVGAERGKDICKKQIETLYIRKPSVMDIERLYANLSNLWKFNFISNMMSKSMLMQRLPVLKGLNSVPMILHNSLTSPQCSSLLKIKADGKGITEGKNKVDSSQWVLFDSANKAQIKHTNILEAINEIQGGENSLRDDNVRVEIKVQSVSSTELSNTKAPASEHSSQDFGIEPEETVSELLVNEKISKNQEVLRNAYMHPKQIQQWLQQILVETEIEPMVHEVGQFSEISQVRFCNEFPVET